MALSLGCLLALPSARSLRAVVYASPSARMSTSTTICKKSAGGVRLHTSSHARAQVEGRYVSVSTTCVNVLGASLHCSSLSVTLAVTAHEHASISHTPDPRSWPESLYSHCTAPQTSAPPYRPCPPPQTGSAAPLHNTTALANARPGFQLVQNITRNCITTALFLLQSQVELLHGRHATAPRCGVSVSADALPTALIYNIHSTRRCSRVEIRYPP